MPAVPVLATCDTTLHAARRAPFFLMAHHRSGSNFLTDLLQQHGHIECLNEPLSMHTRLFRECDLALWNAEDFRPDTLHSSLADDGLMRQFLLDMREYLMQSRMERVIGFKDTCLFGKLGWLKAFMPELKIIFLRRDVRAIVSSVLRSKLAGFWAYAELVPPTYAQLFPHYSSRVAPSDTAMRAAEIAAMSVTARYELARRTAGLFDLLTLDLEELMHHPLHCTHALCNFLGVDFDPRQVAFIAARGRERRGGPFSSFREMEDVRDAWRTHLSPRQIEVVEDVMRAAAAPSQDVGPSEVSPS
jgi:hypothetical protein